MKLFFASILGVLAFVGITLAEQPMVDFPKCDLRRDVRHQQLHGLKAVGVEIGYLPSAIENLEMSAVMLKAHAEDLLKRAGMNILEGVHDSDQSVHPVLSIKIAAKAPEGKNKSGDQLEEANARLELVETATLDRYPTSRVRVITYSNSLFPYVYVPTGKSFLNQYLNPLLLDFARDVNCANRKIGD